MAHRFRGNQGGVLIRESVKVAAAGGPAPQLDWKASDMSPDLSKAMARETLSAARDSACMAFGVLPGLTPSATTGPMVLVAQRHLAQWQPIPIAAMIGQEASEMQGGTVELDVM